MPVRFWRKNPNLIDEEEEELVPLTFIGSKAQVILIHEGIANQVQSDSIF